MGAKQSKRSVDISGKEAESAGEVAAGAGGEGRVEQLADADALKPQLNGDAHIHDTAEKVKELDSGTPENEKDATTEKEGKEQEEEKDKESSVVITNGDSEQKADAGESTPSPEDTKKPKKEKVKKKWSLRSISFSRKDKPKQEKKQKEEEAKTNGEPEKVPEEVAESSPEKETNGVIQEDKSETETRDEKTPETPVTEPITNGSSSPETPQEQTPTTDEPTNATKENERTESPKDEVVPEHLPINGLSLEEPKIEISEPVEIVAKAEETIVEKSEPVPATPDKNEVCVEKSPLIEPSPPPLPANPPPSSVASFAATTMAPELTDAPLANPAVVTSNATRVDIPETNSEIKVEPVSLDVQRTDPIVETETVMKVENIEVEQLIVTSESDADVNDKEMLIFITNEDKTDSEVQETVSIDIAQENINLENNVSNDIVPLNDSVNVKNESQSLNADRKSPETIVDDLPEQNIVITDNDKHSANDDESKQLQPIERDVALATNKTDSENGLTESAEAPKEIFQNDDLKEINKIKDSTQTVEVVECNGRLGDEIALTNGEATPAIDDVADSTPPSLSDASLPPPPSDLGDAPAPQELISVSDKMAELIPEVPSVPELKTELETTTDVAVAN
ncbi:A-kinase anchor protein 200-like [Maniola hyperantus]|uniref:A-kinase anchor protein 200-like n=1 Tax=Aphantopus hyperantus TaxID=2795564 RepID=UPI00156867F7|nr:A-kinase anchor protein 200 isoform X1 [Maniola hyperantus]